MIEFSKRLEQLPPYLFARIDKIKQEEIAKGKTLIALGIGDPDLPTPDFIIERLVQAAKNPRNHQYPSYEGMIEFRRAASRFMQRRFGVAVRAENEVLALIGSKEGIAHLPFAFLNPQDAVLVPDPGYPVYSAATLIAGGTVKRFVLRPENHFLPDFSELERLVKEGARTKILFLNYPNNPTAATASVDFFKDAVTFAKKHDLILCHDNAYSEVSLNDTRSPSILEVPGAMDVAIEFHSLSKTYNMTGWRVGFAVGNARIIEGLGKIKTNVDSGVFNAVQEAGIAALDEGDSFIASMRNIYRQRMDLLVPALHKAGLVFPPPQATFYIWAKLPSGAKETSEEFVLRLIREKGIVATPGTGFGNSAEGFVRFTICSDVEILKQVARMLS